MRLQRLRLACRSGGRLIHVFRQIDSIHFERAPPCEKKRSRRRNRKPNERKRSPRRAGEQRRPTGGRLLSVFRRWRLLQRKQPTSPPSTKPPQRHVFRQIDSIHFERAPPCEKKRSRRRNRKP